jgi:hypothetical protein
MRVQESAGLSHNFSLHPHERGLHIALHSLHSPALCSSNGATMHKSADERLTLVHSSIALVASSDGTAPAVVAEICRHRAEALREGGKKYSSLPMPTVPPWIHHGRALNLGGGDGLAR